MCILRDAAILYFIGKIWQKKQNGGDVCVYREREKERGRWPVNPVKCSAK